jgi:hypothetical protein
MFHILIVYDYNRKVNDFRLSERGTIVANTEPFGIDVLQSTSIANGIKSDSSGTA